VREEDLPVPRTSDEAKSVTPPPEALLHCPPPPALEARQAAEWQAIVARLGSQWLPREAHALLTAYCMVKVQLDDVHGALAAFAPGIPEDRPGWQRYRELTKLRGQLATQLASLGTKLRLTPQSRADKYWAAAEARRRGSRPPPWGHGEVEQ
jgi:phage terminase small subunit